MDYYKLMLLIIKTKIQQCTVNGNNDLINIWL